MLVDNNFIGHDNMRRLQLGIAGALVLHALILIKLIYPASQKIISADIFSPPTNITISLLAPIKEPPRIVPKELKIVEPIQKKPVVKTDGSSGTSKTDISGANGSASTEDSQDEKGEAGEPSGDSKDQSRTTDEAKSEGGLEDTETGEKPKPLDFKA